MGKIIILDEQTANRIAAGEVVERPASVVKELVENSIDAGAKSISVDIVNGGITEIKVSDDGSGLSREDMEVAFERHSTSKIRRIEDLDSLRAFGFRGEALASIASVSRITMMSKDRETDEGNELVMESGRIKKLVTTSCNYGTTIKVNDLFFNLPARYKFLKSDSTEASHISDMLSKLALANPRVSIKYSSNRKSIFSTPGDGEMSSVIYALYGRSFTGDLNKVNFTSGKYVLTGYTSSSGLFRRNRDAQMVFLNKRYVRSKIFNAAIDMAYEQHLTKGKHPAVFLNLSVDPSLADINVHPQKLEVRFSDEKAVFSLICSGLQDVLLNKAPQGTNVSETVYMPIISTPTSGYVKKFTEAITDEKTVRTDISEYFAFKPEKLKDNVKNTDRYKELTDGAKMIGQFFNSYLLLEKDDKLIFVDQHAAHERINYEAILRRRRSNNKNVQKLLDPYTVDLSEREMITVSENLTFINEIGYDMEMFGNNTYIIRGIPATAISSPIRDSFMIILEQLKNHNYEVNDENIAMIACKASLKANDKLKEPEMEALVRQLGETDNPFHCPHGRPVLHIMHKYEIEKIFQR